MNNPLCTDGNAALFQSKFLFVLAANQKDCLAAARDLGYTAGAVGYNFNVQLKDVELLRLNRSNRSMIDYDQ